MLMVFDVLFELFVRFLTRDSSVVLVVRKYILEVSQSGPPACTIPVGARGIGGHHGQGGGTYEVAGTKIYEHIHTEAT